MSSNDDVIKNEDVKDVEEQATGFSEEEFLKLQQDFKGLQDQSENLQNQLKRAIADYHNLEKRVAEGRSELTSWAASELVLKLIAVLDHYDKALEMAGDEEKKSGWYKGVEIATQQLRNVLKDEGLEQILADGQFDPALHEAVDTRDGEDNKILEVTQKGYKLNGKVVRPAKVVVGKKG